MHRLLLFLFIIFPITSKAALMEDKDYKKAIFAGGCFWCIEAGFDLVDGVIATHSGYIGGTTKNPTYQQVSQGNTGHAEAVEVVYDPKVVDYKFLLKVFWQNIDPLDAGGQFYDRGSHYRTAIFTLDDEQHKLALASKEEIQAKFDEIVVTEVTPASTFYKAEIYHQDYYIKNPERYKLYSEGSGRKRTLESLWKNYWD